MKIELKNNSIKEKLVKKELEDLLEKYDLNKYIFTKTVVIDEGSVPHSHPVLTIHTRAQGNEESLLSIFLHEQAHWFLSKNKKKTILVIKDLKKIYPDIPHEGKNEYSSYLHLIICWLELNALRNFLSKKEVDEVFLKSPVYKKIRRIVISDYNKISKIIKKHYEKVL